MCINISLWLWFTIPQWFRDVEHIFQVFICYIHIPFGEIALHVLCSFSNCIAWVFLTAEFLGFFTYSKYSSLSDMWFTFLFFTQSILSFHSLNRVLSQSKSFKFWSSSIYQNFLFWIKFWCGVQSKHSSLSLRS